MTSQPAKRVAGSLQLGLSLLELMVAISLSVIIMAAAASIYIASKRSLTESDQLAGITENGQFALQVISYATKHVGFFGGVFSEDISNDDLLTPIDSDCSYPADAYNTIDSLVAAVADTDGKAFGCITDAVPGTDVLVIKNVMPDPIAADPNDTTGNTFPSNEIDDEQTYIVANSEGGLLVDGKDPMPNVGVGAAFALANAWPYNAEIFYVRNLPNPTLSRKILRWGSGKMEWDTQDLVQGVENMRFLFSFNTDVDGTADTVSAADPNDVGASGWDQATSMQVYILLRAENNEFDYTNEKTYTLGDRVITPNDYDDSFRRILLHADITLRNPRITLRGAI